MRGQNMDCPIQLFERQTRRPPLLQRNLHKAESTFSTRRWQYRSIFIHLAVVAPQICEITRNSEKNWTYSSSRSSKLIRPWSQSKANMQLPLWVIHPCMWGTDRHTYRRTGN